MNKFEFNKTMECLGMEKSKYCEFGLKKIYHDDSYYAIVNGTIPYELANLISKKYDNNRYKIRVDGMNESVIPTHDVHTYHIDTIEGLIVFLLETQDYFLKTEDCSKNFETILNQVYSKILQKVNPYISIYDWMLDRETRKEYFKTVLSASTSLDFKIRKKIEKFDNIVNPFCCDNLSLNNHQFTVNGYTEPNYNYFSLTDKENKNTFTTIKSENGFVVKFHIVTESVYGITVYHYFLQNGEEIAFEKYDKNGFSRIEYNLTNNTFGEHYGTKKQATVDDKKFVLESLEKYIDLANSIVEKNMTVVPTKKTFLKK